MRQVFPGGIGEGWGMKPSGGRHDILKELGSHLLQVFLFLHGFVREGFNILLVQTWPLIITGGRWSTENVPLLLLIDFSYT